MHQQNTMVTLTYNDEHLPTFPHSLDVKHHQLFMKKLRNKYPNKTIRFYNGAEYGQPTIDNNFIGRPHFHTILFNHEFSDQVLFRNTDAGEIFTSETLEEIWGRGFCSVVELNQTTANYVARYCMKKINGDKADEHYKKVCPITGEIQNVRPEFSTMSRRPGIAQKWYEKYKSDVFPSDMVIVKGVRVKTPSYYDSILQSESPEQLVKIKKDREEYGLKNLKEQTKKRLHIRETVKKAQAAKLTRQL